MRYTIVKSSFMRVAFEPKKVGQIIHAGGVVLFPTETIYGLICDATNPQALLKIYQIKGRNFGKAFPILVRDFKMLAEYANFTPEQKKFIQKTKRPTSFVLKAKNLSPLATQKKSGAFRFSTHPMVKKLFTVVDKPIVATSANLSTKDPISDPRKYKEVFGSKSDLIEGVVFAGVNKKKKGSTIVNLTVRPFKVLRT